MLFIFKTSDVNAIFSDEFCKTSWWSHPSLTALRQQTWVLHFASPSITWFGVLSDFTFTPAHDYQIIWVRWMYVHYHLIHMFNSHFYISEVLKLVSLLAFKACLLWDNAPTINNSSLNTRLYCSLECNLVVSDSFSNMPAFTIYHPSITSGPCIVIEWPNMHHRRLHQRKYGKVWKYHGLAYPSTQSKPVSLISKCATTIIPRQSG